MTATAARRRARTSFASLLALLLGITGLAVALAPTPAGAATPYPVRVMFLGDSITGSPGCWRALLWQDLQAAGWSGLDAVGTLGSQGCGVPHDGDHEGHAGVLVTDVAAQGRLVDWLAQTDPDVVVMHLGTNDVWSDRPTQQILDAYTTLVQQMRASNSLMKIVVAQIVPNAWPTCAECPARTAALNEAIPLWAEGLTTHASPILVVDHWTGWDPQVHTTDGVHPNAAGDRRMADTWFEPVQRAIGWVNAPDPLPDPPEPDPDPVPDPGPEEPIPADACTATLHVQSSWPGGFVATVEVTAVEPLVTGWRVGMHLAEGTQITHAWNAELERAGNLVVARNAPWNAAVPSGGTTSFGFQGTGSPDGVLAPSCGWG